MKLNKYITLIPIIITTLVTIIWFLFFRNNFIFSVIEVVAVASCIAGTVYLFLSLNKNTVEYQKLSSTVSEKEKELEEGKAKQKKLKDKTIQLQQRIFEISESYSTKIIENLKEANNRNIFIQSVLDSINVSVYSLNHKGIIVSINKTMLEEIGVEDKEEIIGNRYDILSYIEKDHLDKVFVDGVYESIENVEEIVFVNYNELDILKSISVVIGEENDFLGAVISFVNITHLKDLQRELHHINKQNQDILNNIKSGIITIGPDSIIKSQYSQFMEELFPDRNIAGENVIEFLIKNLIDNNTEDYLISLLDIILNRKRTPVSTVNGMPIAKEFPVRLLIEKHDEEELLQKYYKLNFERIFEDGEIMGAMLIIEDITDEKQLRENLKKEKEAHQKEIELIYNLLKVNPQLCKDSINESYKNFRQLKSILNRDWNDKGKIDKKTLNVLTRHSHSIKGLTRMLSMADTSQKAHELESLFTEQRDSGMMPFKQFIRQVKDDLAELERVLDKESSLANRIVGIEIDGKKEEGGEEHIPIETEKLETLISSYDDLSMYLASSQSIPKSILIRLLDSIYRIKKGSIMPFIEVLNDMIISISKSLGKKVNNIKLTGNTTEIDYKVLRTLRDPIVHVIRNILDHGIEFPEERKKKGKDPVGNIKFYLYEDETFLTISISDDGAGIDMRKLKEKANKMGISYPDDKKLINILFVDGFSTKDKVSEISGRGVGMSVVKEAVRSLGSKLYVKSSPNKGMSITIKIPVVVIKQEQEIVNG